MYDELVKRLRDNDHEIDCRGCERDCCYPDGISSGKCIIMEAADAIEELTAYVRQIEELRKDGYYLQKIKMMTYGQATMTMPLPGPPKEG